MFTALGGEALPADEPQGSSPGQKHEGTVISSQQILAHYC